MGDRNLTLHNLGFPGISTLGHCEESKKSTLLFWGPDIIPLDDFGG